MNDPVDIVEMFKAKESNKYLNVSAPMVRYSKLEFRRLLRQNNVHLCFTPMIVADSFIRSEEARFNEFTTNKNDQPLIAQFAARNSIEMLKASQLVFPYVNGVDLNCGCPQSWAISKGFGCAMLRKPEVLQDIVNTLRRNLPSKFSISMKLRLLQEDIKTTVDLCQKLEKCNVTFLVVHGRTQWQKNSHPLNVDAMAEIKKSIQIPLIVNGNVRTLEDANQLYKQTKADGVMAARGILANPTLFTGEQNTTIDCLQQWLDIAHSAGDELSFQCFHHHLTFMWGKHMKRQTRVVFNNLSTKEEVLQFMEKLYDIRPKLINNWVPNTVCEYCPDLCESCILGPEPSEDNWKTGSNGKFFSTYKDTIESDESLYFQNGSIFDI